VERHSTRAALGRVLPGSAGRDPSGEAGTARQAGLRAAPSAKLLAGVIFGSLKQSHETSCDLMQATGRSGEEAAGEL